MVESLFSESWYRVADLKPRLRSHAQIHRHTYRQRDWYILEDHSTGNFHRFSVEAYHIIGLMDGRLTLDRIWEAACASLGDNMPTQEEVIRLLSQLHQANVLQTDIPPDVADLYKRHARDRRTRIFGQLLAPFSIRFPIFDPEKFLSKTHFLVRPIFGWIGLLAWGSVVISAFVLAGIHWDQLTTNLADRVLATENLFLLWLAYPLIKTVHEFGHAYAVKQWGGEVHEMGVMLLVFVPVPYVDASSSSAFQDKYQRMLVGGAGIMIEAFLAALAMWAWANVEPGAIRALAFNVMIVAGVSTILFNGNPLLRFDAYYILSDYLEIPNLGSRASRYWGYLCQHYLFRIKEAQNPVNASGEAPWLAFYGLAAFVYRMFIMVRIVLFVAGKFFMVGIGLAFWGVITMLVLPVYKVLKFVFTDPAIKRKQRRVLSIAGSFAALVLGFSMGVPLPSFTVAEGVLRAPENSQIYARTDGFVGHLVVSPGQAVGHGDPLIICENSELETNVRVLEAQLSEYESRHRLSITRSRTEAEILMEEMGRIRAELERKQEEKKDLSIRSPANGRFLLPNAEDLPGRYVRRGMPLGYVVDFSKVTARVVVPQRNIGRVRSETRNIEARLAEFIGEELPAIIKSEVPAASRDLPSMALSLEGGGTLALDPRDKEGLKAFEQLFHLEIAISGYTLNTIGERVFIRFEHDPEALAFRLYRNIRRTLLRKFSV